MQDTFHGEKKSVHIDFFPPIANFFLLAANQDFLKDEFALFLILHEVIR